MKKSQKGFTLVELVVVIAIIGVLAAILVPSMLNYVKKSRLKTANSNAKTAYNAVAEYIADAETKGYSKSALGLEDATGPDQFTVGTWLDCGTMPNDVGDADKVVIQALIENGGEAGGVWICSASINGTDSFCVQWAKTDEDAMVGQYPDAVTWEYWKEHEDDFEAAGNAGSYIDVNA